MQTCAVSSAHSSILDRAVDTDWAFAQSEVLECIQRDMQSIVFEHQCDLVAVTVQSASLCFCYYYVFQRETCTRSPKTGSLHSLCFFPYSVLRLSYGLMSKKQEENAKCRHFLKYTHNCKAHTSAHSLLWHALKTLSTQSPLPSGPAHSHLTRPKPARLSADSCSVSGGDGRTVLTVDCPTAAPC